MCSGSCVIHNLMGRYVGISCYCLCLCLYFSYSLIIYSLSITGIQYFFHWIKMDLIIPKSSTLMHIIWLHLWRLLIILQSSILIAVQCQHEWRTVWGWTEGNDVILSCHDREYIRLQSFNLVLSVKLKSQRNRLVHTAVKVMELREHRLLQILVEMT